MSLLQIAALKTWVTRSCSQLLGNEEHKEPHTKQKRRKIRRWAETKNTSGDKQADVRVARSRVFSLKRFQRLNCSAACGTKHSKTLGLSLSSSAANHITYTGVLSKNKEWHYISIYTYTTLWIFHHI